MPNRLFQGIVNQMRDTLDRNIGVVDEGGTVIACSELGQIGRHKLSAVCPLAVPTPPPTTATFL